MLVLQMCTELEEYHEGNQDQTHISDYQSISKFLHKFSLPISPKSGPLWWCFEGVVLALLGQKRIFLRTNKADQKHCKNWRCESGSEFHKTSPMCERGEWRKQLRDLIIQSLKQNPLGSVLFRAFFGHWQMVEPQEKKGCYERDSYLPYFNHYASRVPVSIKRELNLTIMQVASRTNQVSAWHVHIHCLEVVSSYIRKVMLVFLINLL